MSDQPPLPDDLLRRVHGRAATTPRTSPVDPALTRRVGALDEGDPRAYPADAGEFAARWNACTPPQRDTFVRVFADAAERAGRCFEQNHEALTAEVKTLRSALTMVLTEHRVWAEALYAALDRASEIKPQGSADWVASGDAMRTTVLRDIRAAINDVDAPTIEAREAQDAAERDALAAQVDSLAEQTAVFEDRARNAEANWYALEALESTRAICSRRCLPALSGDAEGAGR